MLSKGVKSIILLLICISFVISQDIRSDQLRNRHKHRSGKQSIHRGNQSHSHSRHDSHHPRHARPVYGYTLPLFSYDYSELIVGAMIERSEDVSELFLAIFIINVDKYIHHPNIIDAVSTDINVYETWNQAIKRSKDSTTSIANSTYYCRLHNNDPKNKNSYNSIGYKIVSQDIESYIDIVRCRILGIHSIYTSLINSKNSSLHVDLIRKQSPISNPNNLISFSVPWKYRYSGYGFAHHFMPQTVNNIRGSNHNPWQQQPRDSRVRVYKACLCVGISQPLHIERSNIPLPMLIEFIEHHLSLEIGYDHIFLGVLINKASSEYLKHAYALRKYILSSRLSIVPLAIDGLDDVGGIEGTVLKDSSNILKSIFSNQCLYYAKGIYDSVSIMNPNELQIYPVNSKSMVQSIQTLFGSQQRYLLEERGGRLSMRNHAAYQRISHILSKGASSAYVYSSICNVTLPSKSFALMISSYGVPDPSDAFGSWGPGDSVWSKDFYSTSKVFGPLRGLKSLIIPTKSAMLITHDHRVISSQCVYDSNPLHPTNRFNSTLEYRESLYIDTHGIYNIHYQGTEPPDITDLDSTICKSLPCTPTLKNKTLLALIDDFRKEALERVHISLTESKISTAFIRNASKEAIDGLDLMPSIGRGSIKPPYWRKCKPGENLESTLSNLFTHIQ